MNGISRLPRAFARSWPRNKLNGKDSLDANRRRRHPARRLWFPRNHKLICGFFLALGWPFGH